MLQQAIILSSLPYCISEIVKRKKVVVIFVIWYGCYIYIYTELLPCLPRTYCRLRLQTQNRNCNFENNVKISLDDSDALPGHHYANLVLVLGYILSNFHFLSLDRIALFRKKRFETNFFVRQNASKFAIFIEKENPLQQFFSFSFQATMIFTL